MGKPLISVIVPVYGVEEYLEKSVNSILNQSLSALEVILVDDGSPDNCGKMCDDYAKRDSRVRVIHQENAGLSAARNVGIDAARAELIGFVDSDDWIDPDMYELLYNMLISENADIACCGVWRGKPQEKLENSQINLSGREALGLVLRYKEPFMWVWNKLYRRELFDDVRFPQGRFFEDIYVTPCLMGKTDRLVISREKKYHYNLRADSVVNSPYSSRMWDLVWTAEDTYRLVEEKYPEYSDIAAAGLHGTYFRVLDKLVMEKPGTYKAERREATAYLKKHFSEIMKSPLLTKPRKAAYLGLFIHEKIYKQAVKIYNRVR